MSTAARGAQDQGIFRRLGAIWRAADPTLQRRLIAIYSLLIGFNVVVWILLLTFATRYPELLGFAVLAYGFGLRHAVDPDHIAAIDNTTRKLMQDGQRPVAVGFFFSLGHSTVVFALSILVALSAAFVKMNLPQMQSVGAVIGTTVSGFFLIVIATINLIVLVDIYKTWRAVVRGGTYDDKALDEYLNNRGLLARIFKPMLRVVGHSRNMYPIGLLFGLGFDTASEVAILGISAKAGATGMPVWLILLLPLIFTAGMALVDTTDGILMLGAYGWAYVKPVRKLYYNLNITLISVVIALFIGGIELAQVLIQETRASGGVWDFVSRQVDISNMGFYIIAIFIISWIVSVAIYKWRGIDRLDDELPRASSSGMAGASK